MGSVVNYGSSYNKNGQTVTRIPKKEEKIENMPTVFRKKHETVYRPEELKSPSIYSPSVLMSQKREDF